MPDRIVKGIRCHPNTAELLTVIARLEGIREGEILRHALMEYLKQMDPVRAKRVFSLMQELRQDWTGDPTGKKLAKLLTDPLLTASKSPLTRIAPKPHQWRNGRPLPQ